MARPPDQPPDDPYDLEEEARALGMLLPPDPAEVLDIGEVDAGNWREFGDILTDSLWIFGSRSREGMHQGHYHGNFVPQIPYQAIRRFTKPGEVVLDPFLGSGTTLIECRRRGRNGIGIELVEETAREARARILAEEDPYNTWQEVIPGDSRSDDVMAQVRQVMQQRGHDQVHLLIMHPPYHDIIRFSDHPRDLSNASTRKEYLRAFQEVVQQTHPLLESRRFLVLVMGDIYCKGEWVPLGFQAMEAVRSAGYRLKSIVVKNIEGNRAKRNLQNLWRQRAFRGHYYLFKHEYVFFFQKKSRLA